MAEYINLLDKLTEGRELPKGYDHWAINTVRADFRTKHDFVWPFPGRVARAQGPFLDHNGSCPSQQGDGICVATTWEGMASGGVPASTLLLVAYRNIDLLGASDYGKLRVKAAKVIDLVDGIRLVSAFGERADLRSANLSSADLSSANLRSADLSSANLSSANLRSANLRSANLRSADLSFADLSFANLSSANLRFADLSSAYLYFPDLYSADLRFADLRFADLSSADLPRLKPQGVILPSGFVYPTS